MCGGVNAQVGFGTTSPSNDIDVESSSATATAVDINNTGGGDPKINFQLSGTSTFSIGIDNSDADKFKIGTSALETNTLFTIDASGNCGIGNTSPGAKLDVDGSAIFNESGAAVNFRVESDGNTDMLYVDGTNNKVGIGTSTPTGRFEVYNTTQNDRTIYTSDGSGWISFVPNLSNLAYNDISSAGDMGIIFSADNSSAAQANGFVIAPHYNTGSAQGIKIMENGNVGIGTPAPSEKLDIESNDATKTAVDINNTGGGDPKINLQLNGTTTFSIGVDNSDADKLKIGTSAPETNTRVTIDNTGNVGVGISSPTRPLHLVNGANPHHAPLLIECSALAGAGIDLIPTVSAVPNGTAGWLIYAAGPTGIAGDGNLGFYEYGTNLSRMVISRGGNVGIGTATPDQRLSVNGNASKTGGGAWATFSDKRLKKNINEFSDGLDKLMQINPVSFQYNGLAGYTNDSTTFVGVIAQDVEKVAPYMIEHVQKKLNENDSVTTDLLMYDGSALTYILVNAVKEQQTIIEAQKKEIEAQKVEIDALKVNALKVAELENKMNAMLLLLNNKTELTVKQ